MTIMAKVMADPRPEGDEWKSIFDGKRMPIFRRVRSLLKL